MKNGQSIQLSFGHCRSVENLPSLHNTDTFFRRSKQLKRAMPAITRKIQLNGSPILMIAYYNFYIKQEYIWGPP
jgi:uncharacterized protein YeeX (DUF496 family)